MASLPCSQRTGAFQTSTGANQRVNIPSPFRIYLHLEHVVVLLSSPKASVTLRDRLYEALSYTWNSQYPSLPLRCNGSELLVTPNVEAALRQLRRYFFRRRLWIDAVCIYQGSLDERAQQIPSTSQIYHNAARFIMWLGDADDTTLRVVRTLKWMLPFSKLGVSIPFLNSVAENLSVKMKARLRFALLRGDQGRKWHLKDLHEESSENNLHGLRQILHHQWFRCIWTLQEISLARRAIVYCGGSRIRRTTLSNAAEYSSIRSIITARPTRYSTLMEGGYNPSVPIYGGTPFLTRTQEVRTLQKHVSFPKRHPPPLPFIINLVLTGLNPEYSATDPKDRIFGLIGLLRVWGFILRVPDHRKTLSEIILEVSTEIAAKHKSLELLLFVVGEHSLKDLPGWVPDFCTVSWYTDGHHLDRWSDKRFDNLNLNFRIEGRKLHLAGIFVDTVDVTTDAMACEKHKNKNLIQDSTELPPKHLIGTLRKSIQFVRATLSSQSCIQDNQTLLLFNLLLHGKVLKYYAEAVHCSEADGRLLEHFRQWLVKLESQDSVLTSWNDHRLDQVQEFISWEIFKANDLEKNEIYDHTMGSNLALLVFQRWIREYTARKRLFTTSLGYIGIGWHVLRKEEQIVYVPGLSSPLLIRRLNNAGSEKTYQLVGSCNLPQLQSGQEVWNIKAEHVRRFELV